MTPDLQPSRIPLPLVLLAGLWILTSVGFEHGGSDAVWTGVGLYFVGKAFFVGPMLLLMAEQFRPGTKPGE